MPQSLEGRLGVCSWSLKPADAAELADLVAQCGLGKIQLALSPIVRKPQDWKDLADRLVAARATVVSGMFGCVGEDYSTLESIRRTGGLLPDEHWPANRAHAEAAMNVALDLDAPRVSTHAGFIPHDSADPSYPRMLERLGALADLYAAAGAELLLETGQETAADLTAFLDALNRPNVGVNFDPANMILYGKGDPIDALRLLMPRVRQIHLKDAVSADKPGAWGRETPLGDGEVDWSAFLAVLREHDYQGDLIIEREAGDSRVRDVIHARDTILAAAQSA